MTKKYLFCDVETTGLPSEGFQPQLLQVGGIIEIEGEERYRFNIPVRPDVDHIIQEQALDTIGKTEEQVRNHSYSQREAKEYLTMIFSKFVNRYARHDKYRLIGYNAKFDMDRLHDLWAYCDDPYLGAFLRFPAYDVAMFAARFRERLELEHLPNMRLATVCAAFEVPLDDAHDAMADIDATRALWKIVQNT